MKKIILSAALIVAGFTCSFAASVEDMAKDALINGGSYEVMGTFGAYDFEPKGDNDKFDWAFTMNGKSYQLRGNQPSDTDVFGWKPVDIVAPTPAWYMFQVDVDGDGTMGKFDWVLLGASSNYATKLKGVADNGSFDYTGKLDVDYKVDASGAVTAGAVGTLEEVEEPVADTCSNGCNSINSNSLTGYTLVTEWKSGVKVVNTKKTTLIFLNNTQAVVVIDYFDGSRRVARGSYHPYEDGHGLAFSFQDATYDNGDSYIGGIESPNGLTKITVGQSHTGGTNNIVTSIIPNADNGIDEITVVSSAVDTPDANTDVPMHDEINGKNIVIYNNVSTAITSSMAQSFAHMQSYESSTELHCTDYGYTTLFTEITAAEDTLNIHGKTYMIGGMLCVESDYSSATAKGPLNIIFWNE